MERHVLLAGGRLIVDARAAEKGAGELVHPLSRQSRVNHMRDAGSVPDGEKRAHHAGGRRAVASDKSWAKPLSRGRLRT